MVNNIEKAVVRHRVARLLCKSQAIFWGGGLGKIYDGKVGIVHYERNIRLNKPVVSSVNSQSA